MCVPLLVHVVHGLAGMTEQYQHSERPRPTRGPHLDRYERRLLHKCPAGRRNCATLAAVGIPVPEGFTEAFGFSAVVFDGDPARASSSAHIDPLTPASTS